VGEHYLIEKNDGKLVEMKNEDKEIEIDGKGKYLFNPKNYIGVLNAVFSDCKELRNPIMEAELNHKSLIGIVKDYHSYVCKDEKCIVYEKKIPFVRIEFAPTLGYNVTGIRFNGNKAYSLVDFTHSFNPSLGILMNTILPRVNERLSIQLEGEAGKYYFYGYRELTKAAETEYTDYHFNVVYLRSLASFRYTYPKGRVRPIACIGGGVQSILWNKSRIISEIERGSVVQTYVSQDIQINYVSLCIYGSVGMDFHITDKTTGFLVLQYDYIAGEGNYIIQNTGVRAGIYL
jgi:hypothetical protein